MRGVAVISMVAFMAMSCATVEEKPVSQAAEDMKIKGTPQLIILPRHRPRPATIPIPVSEPDLPLPQGLAVEKVAMKLRDGTVGFLVRLEDGTKVFLAREPQLFGTFSEGAEFHQNERFARMAESLEGWHFATRDEHHLLDQACLAFSGKNDDMPYGCLFGCWAEPTEDDEGTYAPVIRPGGLVEHQECDKPAGLMFIEGPIRSYLPEMEEDEAS